MPPATMCALPLLSWVVPPLVEVQCVLPPSSMPPVLLPPAVPSLLVPPAPATPLPPPYPAGVAFPPMCPRVWPTCHLERRLAVAPVMPVPPHPFPPPPPPSPPPSRRPPSSVPQPAVPLAAPVVARHCRRRPPLAARSPPTALSPHESPPLSLPAAPRIAVGFRTLLLLLRLPPSARVSPTDGG